MPIRRAGKAREGAEQGGAAAVHRKRRGAGPSASVRGTGAGPSTVDVDVERRRRRRPVVDVSRRSRGVASLHLSDQI